MMNSSFPPNNDFRGPLKEDRWVEQEKQKDLLREGQGETAGNLGPEYELISNSQDIAATLESIGRADEIDDWGCLFVKVGDGDYDAVYGCEASTPLNSSRVYDLLGNGDLHRKVMSQKFPGYYKKGQVPPDNFGRGGEEGLRESSRRGPQEIAPGLYLHKTGMDANGNHSAWVSQGSNRAHKIQTNQNTPAAHGKSMADILADDQAKEELASHFRKHHGKKSIKENIMEEGKEVRSFEIHDHGIDHAQYFPGHGLFHSKMEDTALGVGDDFQEALDDALDILAQNGWTNLEMIEQSEAMEGTSGSVSAELYEQARDEVLAEHPEFIDPLTDDVAEQYVDELEDLITELMQNSDSELNYYVSVDVSSQPEAERPFEESAQESDYEKARAAKYAQGWYPGKEEEDAKDKKTQTNNDDYEAKRNAKYAQGWTPPRQEESTLSWDKDSNGKRMTIREGLSYDPLKEAYPMGDEHLPGADEIVDEDNDFAEEESFKEKAWNFIKVQFGNLVEETDLEDAFEVALYWYAHDYYNGQGDELYEILSTSPYHPGPMEKSPAEDEDEEALETAIYNDLVAEYEGEEIEPGDPEENYWPGDYRESAKGQKALKEGARDQGLDEVVAHVMKEMPPEVKEAIGAARWNLEFGPSGGGSAMGWQEALDVIRPWAQDLGTVYYDYETGAISDLFPEGGEDEDGEWSEYNGDWYEYEPREILRGIMGELASYVESAPSKGQALKESRQILEIRMMDKGFGIFDRSMRGSKPIAKAKTWQEAREKIMQMLRDDQTPTWARGEGSLQKVLDRRRSSK